MDEVKRLDPRLSAFVPIIDELKALRQYLDEINTDLVRQRAVHVSTMRDQQGDPVSYEVPLNLEVPIHWIDDSLHRIEPHLHSRWWPPVWLRLDSIRADISSIFVGFHRLNSDGILHYIPQCDEIMSRVVRIEAKYKQVAKER